MLTYTDLKKKKKKNVKFKQATEDFAIFISFSGWFKIRDVLTN